MQNTEFQPPFEYNERELFEQKIHAIIGKILRHYSESYDSFCSALADEQALEEEASSSQLQYLECEVENLEWLVKALRHVHIHIRKRCIA